MRLRLGKTKKTSASGDGRYSGQTSQKDVGLSERRDVDAASAARRRHVLCRADRRAHAGRTLHCGDGHVRRVAARTAEVLPPVTYQPVTQSIGYKWLIGLETVVAADYYLRQGWRVLASVCLFVCEQLPVKKYRADLHENFTRVFGPLY